MTITILDGGMGQELLARTGATPTPLWATQVMMDYPQAVRDIHDDFFAAGAEIATTNTYAIQHDRLMPLGQDHLFADLHRIACEAAVAARDAHGSGQVAGAAGPLGASYRPDLAPPAEEAAAFYAEIAELQAPYVDFFLLETMSSVDQARGALMGTQDRGKPVWLAVSTQDTDGTLLRSGEPLEALLPLLAERRPDAVLINCTTPEAVDQGLPILAGAGLTFGAYANGFTRIAEAFKVRGQVVDSLTAREDLSPERYADFAEGWARMGATILGGCCEVGPAHIRALADRLRVPADA